MKARLAIMVIAGWGSVAAAEVSSDIARCTAIESDTERLACYDKLFARPEAKMQKGQPTPSQSAATPSAPAGAGAAEAAAAQAGADDFGLDGRKPGEQPTEPKGPDEIQARVSKIVTQPRGEAVLTLDNGQVWQQQEYDWHLAFKVGDEVIIKRGVLKSYRLQQKGNNRSTSVTRIR